MEIEDVVGVKFGIENEVDMEEKDRGWDLEDIAGDSLTLAICSIAEKASPTKLNSNDDSGSPCLSPL
jgi:hypothetical protein